MKSEKIHTRNNEQGMALVFAVIISLVLAVLGLGLTMFSLTEFSSGREYESNIRAFAIADGGFNLTKASLAEQDLTDLLETDTAVPEYVNSEAASSGKAPYRNPIYPLDARNIDYFDPPSPLGYINVPGMLTPPSGTPLGSGHFFARISDNDDGDDDDTFDSDFTVFLRVVGVHPAPIGEMYAHGGYARNSVSIIEGMVKRDTSFDLGSPLSLAGPDINVRMNGNSFDIVGDENHPGVSVFYDDEGSGDASQAAQSVYDSMKKNQKKNIVGAEGDFGPYPEPSIRDDTDQIRNSSNPDARNVLNPNFLYNFTRAVSGMADSLYSGDVHLAGGGIELGTQDNPAITYVEGDLKLSGSGSGYGILVVTGSFDYRGAFDFDGLVMVVGEGEVDISGANKDITGGMLVAKLEESGTGHEFGVPDVSISGNSGFIFDSSAISLALNLFPMKTTMWREITPDIEPPNAGN